jgi:predicted DNA-binding transcriptional regulator AlpA
MKFTQVVIDRLRLPKNKREHTEWDADTRQLGVHLTVDGPATYVVNTPSKTVVLGRTSKLKLKLARSIAEQIAECFETTSKPEKAVRSERRSARLSSCDEAPDTQPVMRRPTRDYSPTRLIQYKDLAGRGIRFTRRHLLTLENAGKFPKRVKVGDRGIGWVEYEIEEFLKGIMDKRDTL